MIIKCIGGLIGIVIIFWLIDLLSLIFVLNFLFIILLKL